MSMFRFRGGRFLDVRLGELCEGVEVLVEGNVVREVADRPINAPSADIVELGGRILMPGLIDNHVHMYYFLNNTGGMTMRTASATYSAAMATATLKGMLMRGFTTVRDAGGADYGLAQAVAEGLIPGPRLLFCGHALSQTGGHGDVRGRGLEREVRGVVGQVQEVRLAGRAGVGEEVEGVVAEHVRRVEPVRGVRPR